jgi:hypothetical protein
VSLVGKEVRWSGEIQELQLGRKVIVPGLRVQMPLVSVRLPDDTPFIGDFLFLELPADADQRVARQMKVGDCVTFTGRFQDPAVFPDASFTHDRERGEVILPIGLDEGRLIPYRRQIRSVSQFSRTMKLVARRTAS